MTITELKRDKITLRKTDALRATAYGMLINIAEQNAKRTNHEVSDADIGAAAKIMKNQLEATIIEYENVKADTSELKAELAIYVEFVPKGMPEDEVRKHVIDFLASIPTEDKIKKNAGRFKGALKQKVPGIDMTIASKILDELL